MKINAVITPQLVEAVNHMTEHDSENAIFYIEMLHEIKTHFIFTLGNGNEDGDGDKTITYLQEISTLQEMMKGFIQKAEN